MIDDIVKRINESENIKELEEIQKMLETRLTIIKRQQIDSARKKVQELADDIGVDVATLVPQLKKIAVKYINKKDLTETWSGRGKKPRWLTKALENGAKLEDFLI